MKRTSHFTLIELLAVIGIIAILASITVGGFGYASRRADAAKTQAIMEEFTMALEAFKQDRGYYPIMKTADDVILKKDDDSPWKAFLKGNSKTKKPYMENLKPWEDMANDEEITLEDAYGKALQYQCPGSHNSFDLWSKGPDKHNGDKKAATTHPGDGDDICNWKQN